jgi:hypothetical protein
VHRLRIAGYDGPALFTPESMQMIAAHSEGVPRSINNLCFGTLSLGCALKTKVIDAAIVKEVLVDLDVKRLGSRSEATTSKPKDQSRTHPAEDKGDFVSPLGKQSPMTFARLLRKIDGPSDREEESAAPRASDPVHSIASSRPGSDDAEPEVTHPQFESLETAPVLGRRLNARLSPVQQPLIGEALPPEGVPSAQVARRNQRGRGKYPLLMAMLVLFTACFYQPKARIEAASLIQPNQRMQQNPRAEQLSVPAALPSNRTNSDNRSQPNAIVDQTSEIEEM